MPIEVSNLEGQNWVTLEALVDTGASICCLPTPILHQLNVLSTTKYQFEFGQRQGREMDIGQMWLRSTKVCTTDSIDSQIRRLCFSIQ